MNIPRRAGLAIMVLATLGACTTLPSKQSSVTQAPPAAADTPLDPADMPAATIPPSATGPATAQLAGGTGAQLQQLIQRQAVTELRTSYNGSYGASLLFDGQTLEYYVALFHDKNFWKVRKTLNQQRAEQIYEQFSKESASLAEADLKRIRLQADYTRTEAQLNEQTARLNALQNDLEAQREQARQITAQQAISREEAARLDKQQADAEKRLRTLKETIRQLEAQQSRLR